jgi:hypothetical protein
VSGILRRKWLAVLALVLLAGAGCGDDDEDDGQTQPTPQPMQSAVFFGAVSRTTDRLALAFDGDLQGTSKVRVFLTDGEPGGDVEWFEGDASGGRFNLRSASGRASIEGAYEAEETHGQVTLADGQKRFFHTIPANAGAGSYEITVGADGRYTGTSTDGNRLEARQVGDYVQGTITTRSNERVDFKVTDLSRVFRYSTIGGQPDTYTTIIARHGLVLMGRGGDVKRGAPSPNLLSLDLAESSAPSPGVYYGRTAMTIHQFAAVVDPTAAGGPRLRVYFSDGLDGGDIEWFVGTVNAGKFDLTSASRRARIEGDLATDSIRGTVTLGGGRQLPVFAVPAGDGAGIYEVEVTTDGRYVGTSEDGSRLEARKDGDRVIGSITPKVGAPVSIFGYDLTHVFHYAVQGSQPDKYLAFASPGGRYIIGRSGDVRGGTAGNNIIGLDKAC